MNAGVEFATKNPIKRNGIETTQVKSIICLTDLDDGAANDGSGSLIEKSGVILNKKYKFEVESYTNGEPENKDLIRWVLSYTDADNQFYYNDILSDTITGDSITIKFTSKITCGKNLQVKAFINNQENEGKLNIFHHNRYRFFDRKITELETKQRMYSGRDIEQGASSMCGIAVIGHLLAIENPNEYQKIILDLHRKGETIITSTKYKITLDKDDHLCDIKDSDSVYPNNKYGNKLSYADYVFLFSIKDYLNNFFDYDPDGPNSGVGVEGTTGFTPPIEIQGMMKNILAYSDIKDNTNIATSKWSSAKKSCEDLQEVLSNGYKIALLISADNFSKNTKSIFTVPNHWVGLKKISIDEEKKQVNVKVFTWGYINQSWTLSIESFEDGYFGYVAGK